MSVSNETVRVSASASGSQTAFPFTNILVFDGSDLNVYQNDVLLSEGPDYSVSLSGTAPADGTVNLVSGATAGDVILIERVSDRTQLTVYNPGTSFPAKSHENALDRLTLQTQDLDLLLKYTPRFDQGRTLNFDWKYLNLPDAVTSKVPVFDPATKTVSWSDTGEPTSSLAFSALTGTLDISGDDARIEDITKSYANAVARDLRSLLNDWKSVKDFGATGDGATDDTTAINNALATAGLIYFPPGTYLISAALEVQTGTLIMGAGRQATVIKTATSHRMVDIIDTSDITLTHLTLEGAHAGGIGGNDLNHAIFVDSSTGGTGDRISIQDVEIKDVTGRAIDVANTSTNVIVHGCRLTNCRAGVFVFKGNTDISVSSNHFISIREGSIQIDDATSGDTAGTADPNARALVTGNIINECGKDTSNEGVAIVFSGLKVGGIIANNVIVGNGDEGVTAARAIVLNSGEGDFNSTDRVVVSGNVCTGCAGRALTLQGVRDVAVTGNTFVNNNVWDTSLSNAPEVKILEGAASSEVTTSVVLSGNLIHNTGGTNSRSTVGVEFTDTSQVSVFVGLNAIINMTIPYRSLVGAGDVVWTTIETLSALPSHDDGFKGRVVYEDDRQILAQNNGSQWNSVSPLAWCKFDGSGTDPITIDDGHNVTNVTKNGTGSYTVNFSETLSNANYAAVAGQNIGMAAIGSATTTSVNVVTRNTSAALADASDISLIIFGSSS